MFNEKKVEKINGQDFEVWQSPKYIESREKAVEMIKSDKWNLREGDFWILMNKTKNGKMAYTGLIISHNGCLKINDKLDENLKFKSECLSRTDNAYGGSLIYEYNCKEQGLYEVGEVSEKNCQNDYPFAMAFKRCFDRVVLKNSKLAFSGIYSEEESEEFKQQIEAPQITLDKELVKQLIGLGGTLEIAATYFKVSQSELTNEHIQKLIDLKLENIAKNGNN
jgi:hypothetical protein